MHFMLPTAFLSFHKLNLAYFFLCYLQYFKIFISWILCSFLKKKILNTNHIVRNFYILTSSILCMRRHWYIYIRVRWQVADTLQIYQMLAVSVRLLILYVVLSCHMKCCDCFSPFLDVLFLFSFRFVMDQKCFVGNS